MSEEVRGINASAKYHKCSKCKKSFEWNSQSCWYGSYKEMDEGAIEKACSIECGKKLWGEDYLGKIDKDIFKEYKKRN